MRWGEGKALPEWNPAGWHGMKIYTQGLWQHSHSLGAWADNGQSYHSMKGCPASRWLALVCQDASAWVLLSWILLTLESSLGHIYLMATCLRFSLQEDRVNRGGHIHSYFILQHKTALFPLCPSPFRVVILTWSLQVINRAMMVVITDEILPNSTWQRHRNVGKHWGKRQCR